MLEQEKITRGQLIAKLLNLKYHKAYARDEENIRYNTSWGTKTNLGLYETVNRILTDDVEKLQKIFK